MRPYPRVDRARHQIQRATIHRHPMPPPIVVEFTADTSRLKDALSRAHTAAVFASHPDLRALDREVNGWGATGRPRAAGSSEGES